LSSHYYIVQFYRAHVFETLGFCKTLCTTTIVGKHTERTILLKNLKFCWIQIWK